MPRALRIEYPGAVYHVVNRGHRSEPIFRDDADRERFLDALSDTCSRTDWQVHALCLMHNHFHLVVQTPKPNLVAGMKRFLGTYTARFNRRHSFRGHLFSGRYRASVIDSTSPGYLRAACEYVHLNPVRAQVLGAHEELREYRWSSYPEYLKPPGQRWHWLRVDRLLGEMGLPKDSSAARREFARQTEERRANATSADWRAIRRGWFFGGGKLKAELLAQDTGRVGARHYGVERSETDEAKAERLVREELAMLRWTELDLTGRRKGDPGKVAMARRLRRETTMTLRWIAQRLRMGAWTYVSSLVRAAEAAERER